MEGYLSEKPRQEVEAETAEIHGLNRTEDRWGQIVDDENGKMPREHLRQQPHHIMTCRKNKSFNRTPFRMIP